MAKTAINSKTRFAIRPFIADQLQGISDDCLLLTHSAIKTGLSMFAFGGVLTFLFIGLPAILFIVFSPLLPPYGYRDDGTEILNFTESIVEIHFMAYVVYFALIIIFGGMAYLMTHNWSRLTKKEISKSTSPLLFNRQTQMVSAVYRSKEVSIPWHEIKGTVETRTSMGPGVVAMTRGFIILEGVGQIEGDEAAWEYIRTFMQEGPSRLKIVPYISDAWEHQPKYSRTFKQAIDHHWPWPIMKNPGLGSIISWLIWPIKVVMFIPFILTEWYWRRMIIKTYKNSNTFPAHRWTACAGKRITGQMATQVATKDDLDTDGINYLELKRRLKM